MRSATNGTVALSDRPTRSAPPAHPEAMREAFKCPIYWGLSGRLRVLPPGLVHGEDTLSLNATVPCLVGHHLDRRHDGGGQSTVEKPPACAAVPPR